MDLNKIISEKRANSELLKTKYSLLQKNKCIGLIKISDKELINKLHDPLKNIDCSFIIDDGGTKIKKIYKNVFSGGVNEKELLGFDFILCDDDIEDIGKYLSKGIAPIIAKNNYLTSILKEFDALRGTGNSFFYTKSNKWSIFISLIKYLENYKFPYDNKNLVKNILEV